MSAITKTLWMLKGHPVVIYDSRARLGLCQLKLLKPNDKNYAAFYAAWIRLFKAKKKEIRQAQKWLLKSAFVEELSNEWGADWEKVQKFIKSLDFQNRVIDKYLWSLGQEAKQAPHD